MRFEFGAKECGNLLSVLDHEWLETNGLGGYSSSTLAGCNTRRYHGLLVVNLPQFADRHVLLSTLDERIICNGTSYALATRQHQGCFYPDGYKRLSSAKAGVYPVSTFQCGTVTVKRAVLCIHQKDLVIIRYSFSQPPSDGILHVTPLLACRSFHALTRENSGISSKTSAIPGGFGIQLYSSLPPLYIQSQTPVASFDEDSDWCRNVRYMKEEERGFPFEEDLYIPGHLSIPVTKSTVYLAAGTRPFQEYYPHDSQTMEEVWHTETERRKQAVASLADQTPLEEQLSTAASAFIVRQPNIGASIIAGYHWFNSWGRDTFIALPGLCFCTKRYSAGQEILLAACHQASKGLIANFISPAGDRSYNCVDASLWFIWAVQQMLHYIPGSLDLIRQKIWPFLKEIIAAYSSNSAVPYTIMDGNGFLEVGTPETQLTWMDATVYEKPVTPRDGFPVEINALWYNALSFVNVLASVFKEDHIYPPQTLADMPRHFIKRFMVTEDGQEYLADTWHPANPSYQIRPNQIFAISLPYPVIQEQNTARAILRTVTANLFTPFGMRTLAPSDKHYCPSYHGLPHERDACYHQGTVWPWLLGAYGEAMLKTSTSKSAAALCILQRITPLLKNHLSQAGIGGISEIFGGDYPHPPDGCIFQAWSVAEVLRLITLIKYHCPGVYETYAGTIKDLIQ